MKLDHRGYTMVEVLIASILLISISAIMYITVRITTRNEVTAECSHSSTFLKDKKTQ